MDSIDDDSDQLNRFREAFDRGQRGDVGSLDIWLEEHGYIAEHVDHDALTQYFRDHPERTSDHQIALETIGEYVGFATNRSGTFHIPVIGPTGIGKTQLLYTVINFLPKIDSDINSRLFDATAFGKRINDRFVLNDRIEEIESVDTPVVFIDDCYLDKRFETSLSELEEVTDGGLFITVWTPEGYAFNREEIADTLPVSKEVYLEPFSNPDTVTALSAIHDYISKDAPKFDEEAEDRIHELSYGVPGLVVTLTLHALREAFMKDLEPGSEAPVEVAGERFQLQGAMDRVYSLSESKIEVLRWILLSLDDRGRSPGDLVDKLNRDKSTISYHLRTLSDDGFVESQKEGRRAYYQVTKAIKPLVQLRLSKEAEFNA